MSARGHSAPRADRDAAAGAAATAAPFAVEPADETERRTRIERLSELLGERIVVLDGAMGTMIQQHRLEERDFRGERFATHGRDLRGNNDILTLTRPEVIAGIHRAYLAAGKLKVETLGRGFAWLDTGTHESILEASQFVAMIEHRQGVKVACPEEIAFGKGWIDSQQVARAADSLAKTSYGQYLRRFLEERQR